MFKGSKKTFIKPIWVKIDKNKKQLLNKDGGEMVLDITKIKDQGSGNLCRMSFSNIKMPMDFLKEGYKFDTYCCATFRTEDGLETMCNVGKPRCWYGMRRFARYIRKMCIEDHATAAGLNLADVLSLESY